MLNIQITSKPIPNTNENYVTFTYNGNEVMSVRIEATHYHELNLKIAECMKTIVFSDIATIQNERYQCYWKNSKNRWVFLGWYPLGYVERENKDYWFCADGCRYSKPKSL